MSKRKPMVNVHVSSKHHVLMYVYRTSFRKMLRVVLLAADLNLSHFLVKTNNLSQVPWSIYAL